MHTHGWEMSSCMPDSAHGRPHRRDAARRAPVPLGHAHDHAMMRAVRRARPAGFEAIDLVGGAVFDVCVRYLREDPWERMRLLDPGVKRRRSSS